MSLMVSTKRNSSVELDSCGIRIVYDTHQDREFVNLMATDLERFSSTKPTISTLSEGDPFEPLIVIVDHAIGSLLLDLDERKLEVLKLIFAQAKGVLWITFGSSGTCKNAGAGAVSGLLGSLRLESGGMNYVVCDIETEDYSQPGIVQAITRIFAKTFSTSNTTSLVEDLEYAV